MAELSDLVGRVIDHIGVSEDEVTFFMEDDAVYKLTHAQDCCESVVVEDVEGDPDDLVGATVLTFEAPSGETYDAIAALYDVEEKYAGSESYTWTFYRLGTDKGGLVIRFIGESNGYYSEEVDFIEVDHQGWRM